MTTVSSKKFAINQDKYLEMELDEQEFFPKEEKIYTVAIANKKKKKYLEPDDDFRRAITMDEFRKRTHEIIHNFFENK